MQQTAKIFATGRSQAVRLPLEFRFNVAEVFIRRDPATGDVVLQCVGRLIAQSVRQSDLAGRIGGEEFAVLMMGTSEAADEVAERLRHVTAQLESSDAPGVRCTISIGVYTCIPRSQEDLTQLLNRADAALYQAKVEGRNRVCVED